MHAAHDRIIATNPEEQDDCALLNRIAQQDPQAYEIYYQRYKPRLTAYLRTLLKSPDMIEDVLQEVMLVVWQQADRYRGTGRVSTWLFGIARHKALRAHAQTTRALSILPSELEVANQDDPERDMARRECERLLRQAFVTLQPVEREVFTLRQEHGYSAQTIATRQACSVATVNYRLRQARRHLARRLSTWGVSLDRDFSSHCAAPTRHVPA